MPLCLEIPSKTFVIGEYLALEGTASMLLATKPCFKIKIRESSSLEVQTDKFEKTDDPFAEFHPDSPAGKLCQKLKQKKTYFIEDPHEGNGGFGRSTAEYLSVLIDDLLSKEKKIESTGDSSSPEKTKTPEIEFHNGKHDIKKFILGNLQNFVTNYQNCTSNYKPSGADLVAQVCGGLCWYDGMNFSCEKPAWPFPGYEIYIFKTGYKQQTHEHLIKDIKNKNLKILIPALMSARLSLEQSNLKIFCQAINDYYDILGGLGFSDSKVQSCVYRLREEPEILAAKACGAMGMDTVLIVARLSDEDKIIKLAKEHGLSFVSQLKQSHKGVCYNRS